MPFPGLDERVAEVRERIAARVRAGGHGQNVRIVAVTKTYGPDAIEAAFSCGLQDVGENRVQEALDKMPKVTVPVAWHLIGHLQRNKVRHLDRFAMLHSLDSSRLAQAVDADARANGRRHRVLVQVNASGEASKGGFTLLELAREAARLRDLDGLDVRGAMTMAPLDADERTLRATFGGARAARDILRDAGLPATELSMGMSGDFEVAVEEGATMVRLGTLLFGARPQ
ncbi:MAG: Pyridoxal phosphate homeostasis protein [Gemmatimonadaceae bacterium]|nr:Pyridoxal phosphate homeostasis protein [Gemmatimonadaceae bacterium]